MSTHIISVCCVIFSLGYTGVTSCSKDKNTAPSCRIDNAIIDVSVTKNTPCTSIYAGNITVTTNIPNIQYNFDNTGFQNNNQFNNVKAGTYSLQIKDANGCITSKAISIADSTYETPGVFFTKVKQIINTKCISCHNKKMPYSSNVLYFDTDCEISVYYNRIHSNAALLRNMPLNGSLTNEQVNDIKEWYNKGGKITD